MRTNQINEPIATYVMHSWGGEGGGGLVPRLTMCKYRSYAHYAVMLT